jgi:hypothetical protein
MEPLDNPVRYEAIILLCNGRGTLFLLLYVSTPTVWKYGYTEKDIYRKAERYTVLVVILKHEMSVCS